MLEALFELVARFLIEFLFYTVFYGGGCVMLKAITLGCYPPPRPKTHNDELFFVPDRNTVCRAHGRLLMSKFEMPILVRSPLAVSLRRERCNNDRS